MKYKKQKRLTVDVARKALYRLGACHDARSWFRAYTSVREAWRECTSSSWMTWLLSELFYKQDVHERIKKVTGKYVDRELYGKKACDLIRQTYTFEQVRNKLLQRYNAIMYRESRQYNE